MNTINVYDSVNRARLLGTLDVACIGPVRGDRIGFAVMPKLSPIYEKVSPLSIYDTIVSKAEFRLDNWEEVPGKGDWMRQRYATTNAALEVLLGIREFRLPGEARFQAEVRRHYS